jgi:D-tyrosyl-tRNA(Tyr) deacylase
VRSASVDVADERVAAIGPGLVVLLGVGADDAPEDGERLAARVAGLRIFEDDGGKMSRSVADRGGEILVVPQFTLYGDVRHGRRPDFTRAARPDKGQRLYDAFCGALRGAGLPVATGRFGAMMRVNIEGDGPVTIVATTDGWDEAGLR